MNLEFLSPLLLIAVFFGSVCLLCLPILLTLFEYWRTRQKLTSLVLRADRNTQHWAFELERRILKEPKNAQNLLISELAFATKEREEILTLFMNIYD